MSTIDLALDWTPNTNHTGFYVAQAKGYYADWDVDLSIHSPAEDDYEQTLAFVDWLAENEILTTVDGNLIPAAELDTTALYTNSCLETNR